ncbi:DUF1223 domain-containing protein [Hymenobacter sp. IS2118]|uniref:DUF1223 domain-containing protein n=1 Tax=Hymenobacter sp. IS2118 TaxID=1505605 RepID=UPI00068B2778|nr:DUF1223 domain-containing protein [Hymenobacter sp. IS2118]
MKRFAWASLLLLAAAAAAVPMSSRPGYPPPQSGAATPPVPVVVELFTSEGCSSCPAADAALREMEAAQSVPGVEIIALGQHVDYWNRLGWKDAFSSAQFTERQRWYAQGFGTGSYTPQAVVNGRYELVGSQRAALLAAATKAARAPRATVALARAANGALTVQVHSLPTGTPTSTVQLALTETGLSSQVGAGENSGRLLRHSAVVRSLRALGTVAADGTFAATVPLILDAGWKPQNLRAVVLVQEQASHHVVGAASLPLGNVALR